MPAVSQGHIFASIQSLFPKGTTLGDDVKLAQAVAEVLAEATAGFVERVKMAPGVPCAVVQPSMSGTVAGVGTLIGVGLVEHELRSKAESVARGLNMTTADSKTFVECLTRLTDLGFERIVTIAKVMPGTPVAGGVTAAPMPIMAPAGAVAGELEGAARALQPPRPPQFPAHTGHTPWTAASPQMGARPRGAPMMGGHRHGAPPRPPQQLKLMLPADFALIVAKSVGAALDQMAGLVLVRPGIPVAGNVTAVPGDLM